ncbi:MAG: MBL fold metallo-hydrolase [Paracoccaceae bacterium]
MTGARPAALQSPETGVRRVLADNGSPMTDWGTNTYLLGEGRVAVIDPGPDDPAHLRAIIAALARGERISHIFVTHAHRDHSALARPLALATGAPVLAFGDALAGRSAAINALAADGLAGGGEGIDRSFCPDETLSDGQTVTCPGWSLSCLHTPGHMANHMCFASGDAVFTGDHVMGWASTLISPPDGDLGAFMRSCRRLAERADRVYYPGHGAPVSEPAGRIRWLMQHRRRGAQQILSALGEGLHDIDAIAAHIYHDVPGALLPAASRNVFAHLIDLVEQSRVKAVPHAALQARYFLK